MQTTKLPTKMVGGHSTCGLNTETVGNRYMSSYIVCIEAFIC